jgi:hypothetical protein
VHIRWEVRVEQLIVQSLHVVALQHINHLLNEYVQCLGIVFLLNDLISLVILRYASLLSMQVLMQTLKHLVAVE